MNYRIKERGSILIIELSHLISEIDNKNLVAEARSHIEKGNHHIILDLTGIDYMNSVGLNCLISLRSRSHQSGGNMIIVRPPSQVIRLLEITKLLPYFSFDDTLTGAISKITNPFNA